MNRFEGRKVLITGAGSGIGRATALRLATEGASIAALDVRREAADRIASEVAQLGAMAIGLTCDVGEEPSVVAAISAVVERFGGLDTVVASAGITLDGATESVTLSEWNVVMRVNLTGVFLTVKHALPHLCAAGAGAIVTIGSVASLVAAGRAASYDASKGAVLQFTRAIAVEYADRGIRANCVCPGVVATDLAAHSQGIGRPDSLTSRPAPRPLRVSVPMNRVADPTEISGVVAFLCSDDASFVTGAAIAADGGYTAI
jgi:NAD(P)-dependent dehydrogenase (short-subunit alcohol dehydrogenase family)